MPVAARPAAPATLGKGLQKYPNQNLGRPDADPPTPVYKVPKYPAQPGFVGRAHGIQPTPLVPRALAPGQSRATMVQYLRSSAPKKEGDTTTKQLVQAAIGGGKPMGPAYKGYLSDLVRSLIQGF